MNRRQFLYAALSAAAGALAAAGCRSARPAGVACTAGRDWTGRKLILVLFGGGTRSSESVDDRDHGFIPRLWNDMIPRGTLFANMRVEHKVVHPNSAGSVVTGHWEWDDLDWSKPVRHPTVFELLRREHGLPDTAAWAFVYAAILARAGYSSAPGYGEAFAPNIVEPPTIPRATAERMDELMRRAAATGRPDAEIEAAAECTRLARATCRIARSGWHSPSAAAFMERQYGRWQDATGTTSHDAFLTDCAIACMEEFAPVVLEVAYGEIDCAHYGSWSRYTEAIRRTDELTARLWQAAEKLPAYRGRTLMLILPDHGRELDAAGSSGFIHHSDFYTNSGADEGCRRVWMLALGPGVAAGRKIARPVPITVAAATGLEFLGLKPSAGAALSVLGECEE
jgi:hypothetical protein